MSTVVQTHTREGSAGVIIEPELREWVNEILNRHPAAGGDEVGLRQEILHALMAPAAPPTRGFYDECLKIEWQLSLGFAKPSSGYGLAFGSPSAFGMPGWGGAFAYADPEVRAGYAYVTNRMGVPGADPREVAIRTAFQRALERRLSRAKTFVGSV